MKKVCEFSILFQVGLKLTVCLYDCVGLATLWVLKFIDWVIAGVRIGIWCVAVTGQG